MDAEEGFFGEPGTSAAELPNGFNHAETGFLESEANQAVGEELYGDWGGRTSEGFEAGYAEGDVSTQEQQQPLQEGEEGQAEQTFGGGYTHQQVSWKQYDPKSCHFDVGPMFAKEEGITLWLCFACSMIRLRSPLKLSEVMPFYAIQATLRISSHSEIQGKEDKYFPCTSNSV